MRKAGCTKGAGFSLAHLLRGARGPSCMKMENLSVDSRQRENQKVGVCFFSNMKSTDSIENWMPFVCARMR